MSIGICLICDLCHEIELISELSLDEHGQCVNENGITYNSDHLSNKYARPINTNATEYHHLCSCCAEEDD